MKHANILAVMLLAGGLLATGHSALAQPGDRDQEQQRQRDQIYGSQLMTEQERNEYRDKMRSMHTEQDRAALREQHHEEMRKRAQSMGMELPEQVPDAAGKKGTHGQPGKVGGPGQGAGNGKGGGAGMGNGKPGGKSGQ